MSVCVQVPPRHLPVQRSGLDELVCRGWITCFSYCFGEGLGHCFIWVKTSFGEQKDDVSSEAM